LQFDTCSRGAVGHRAVQRNGCASLGVDEQELLFDTEGRMISHGRS
jgi:hypothetical protein